MAVQNDKDQLAVIRIQGMHCHKCEMAIKQSLKRLPGIHEVEVDFPTSQASVLYDPKQVVVAEMMAAVTQAGYVPTSFIRSESDAAN